MEILEQKKRTAHKEHKCDWCGGVIKVGDQYNWSKHIADVGLYEWKSHIHCMKVADRFEMFDWCDEGLSESSFCDQITDLYCQYIQTDDDTFTPDIPEQVIALYNLPEDMVFL